jgi:hypothetical protein
MLCPACGRVVFRFLLCNGTKFYLFQKQKNKKTKRIWKSLVNEDNNDRSEAIVRAWSGERGFWERGARIILRVFKYRNSTKNRNFDGYFFQKTIFGESWDLLPWMQKTLQPGLSKWTSYGKNYCPDVHIVRTFAPVRVYPTDVLCPCGRMNVSVRTGTRIRADAANLPAW